MRPPPGPGRAGFAAAALASAAVAFARTGLRPELVLFDPDKGVQLDRTLDVLTGGAWPLLGNAVSDQTIYLGPFGAYFMLPPVAAAGSASAMELWLALWTALAAAALAIFAGRALGGVLTGATAGMLFALNVNVLESAVQPFHAGAQPAFAALAVVLAGRSVGRGSGAALVAGIAVGLAMQCHAASASYALLVPLADLLVHRRLERRRSLAFLGGIVLTHLPWIAHELVNGAPQLHALASYLWAPATDEGLVDSRRFVDGLLLGARPWPVYGLGAGIGTLLAARTLARRAGEPPGERAALAVCLAALAGWLPFAWGLASGSPSFSEPYFSRFLVPGVAPACLLAAYAATSPWRRGGRAGRVLGGLLALGSIAVAADPRGPGARPFWHLPWAPDPSSAEIALTLEGYEALASRVLAEGAKPPGEVLYVGRHDGGAREDPSHLGALLPLLRLSAVAAGEPIAYAKGDAFTVLAGDACGATPRPGRWFEGVEIRSFDRCEALGAWLEERRLGCAVLGQPLYLAAGRADGTPPSSRCVDLAEGDAHRLRRVPDAELGALLSSDDPALQRLATWELVRRDLPAPQAQRALLAERARDAARPRDRIGALWALRAGSAPHATPDPVLAGAHDDPHPAVRDAARGLAAGASVRAPDLARRASDLRAFTGLDPRAVADALCGSDGRDARERVDPSAVAALLRSLGSGSVETRVGAALLAQEALEIALGSCGRAAPGAPAGLPPEELRTRLGTALADEHGAVRKAAAWWSFALGSRAAPPVEALRRATGDPDPEIRQAALMALVEATGARGAAPAELLAALSDADAQVRATAVELLVERGDPRLAERLAPLLDDSDPEVRELARGALEAGKAEPDVSRPAAPRSE